MTGRSGAVRWAGWAVADQAASSLTSFVALVLIARVVSADAFGAVSIVFIVVTVALAIGRGLWGEALLVVVGGSPARRARLEPIVMVGALATGAALGACVVTVGWWVPGPGPGRSAYLAVGLLLPVLLAQDAGRYVAFGRGRPDVAFASDLLWLAGAIGGLLLVGGRDVGVLVAVWLAAAIPALVVVSRGVEHVRSFDPVLGWLREHRNTIWPLTGDIVGNAGFRSLAVVAVIAVGGYVEGGGFRAAQVLMGPVTVVNLAAAPLFLSRYAGEEDRTLRRAVGKAAAVLGLVSTAWVGMVLALPDSLGVELLGASWDEAGALRLPAGAAHICSSIALATFLGLRGAARTAESFRLRTMSGVGLVVAATLGTLVAGPAGAGWAMAAVELATAAVGWRMIARLRPASARMA